MDYLKYNKYIQTILWKFSKVFVILFWTSFITLAFIQPIPREIIILTFFGIVGVVRSITLIIYYRSLDSEKVIPQELIIFTSIFGFIGIPIFIYGVYSDTSLILVASQTFIIFYGAFLTEYLLDYEWNTYKTRFGSITLPVKFGTKNITSKSLVYLLGGYSYTFAEHFSDLSTTEQALLSLPINTPETENKCIRKINKDNGISFVRIDPISTKIIGFDDKLNLKHFLTGAQKDILPTKPICTVCKSQEESAVITENETPYTFPRTSEAESLCEECQNELLDKVLSEDILSEEELAVFYL